MSTLSINFFARTLNFRTDVKAVLPEYAAQRDPSADRRTAYDAGLKFPVIYLLHGFTGDYSDWFTMLPLERYASEYGFAVVMPHGYNSWYHDLPHGPRVAQFLTEELPAAMEAMLPVSASPDRRFLAGLSMGGYGAVQGALRCPDRYRAFASASAVLDRRRLAEQFRDGTPDQKEMLDRLHYCCAGAPEIEEKYTDLIRKGTPVPPHLCLYGEQDPMYPCQFLPFERFARENALPVTLEHSPGAHDFAFWDGAIRRIMGWFRDQ